jgi:hypothetical protein
MRRLKLSDCTRSFGDWILLDRVMQLLRVGRDGNLNLLLCYHERTLIVLVF